VKFWQIPPPSFGGKDRFAPAARQDRKKGRLFEENMEKYIEMQK